MLPKSCPHENDDDFQVPMSTAWKVLKKCQFAVMYEEIHQ